jgi:hypothetical protein
MLRPIGFQCVVVLYIGLHMQLTVRIGLHMQLTLRIGLHMQLTVCILHCDGRRAVRNVTVASVGV